MSNNNNNHNPFLLHKRICENNRDEVVELLKIPFYRENIDLRDAHGYPPSHYAAHFGYVELLAILIENGADPTRKSTMGWSLVQEGIGRRDREVISYLLQHTKKKIHDEFKKRKPQLLKALSEIPDFEMGTTYIYLKKMYIKNIYINFHFISLEIHWEFKSWVPLVSRFCPFDTYKIYKKGSSFRVNTTIVGVEGITFKRGQLSFMFIGDKKRLVTVDFGKKEYAEVSLLNVDENNVDDEVDLLMNSKSITRVKLLQDDIKFEAAKSWFGYEKFEKIGGDQEWNCQLFNVSNVDLKIISRKNSKDKGANDKNNKKHKEIEDVGGGGVETSTTNTGISETGRSDLNSPEKNSETMKEYIARNHDLAMKQKARESTMRNKVNAKDYFEVPDSFDINVPITDKSKFKSLGLLCDGESVNVKHKNFQGCVWISNEFPRKITDLLPIFEVLTPTNKLFSRLSEFISLKFPMEGFPVKLDFPVVPTITATVTFNNYIEKEIDPQHFEIPVDFIKKKDLFSNNN
ncbi:hypothetical protein DFA_08737 [Cavenderia fasciculata]|uniref:Ankyrin repeat domain-containing protein n=1 Tax=Cavenderia fasciculata TaxID=261658 RepID=F4Q3Y2_CACFS|nr:uncharacterized protein DFA_08737 [Cavenderia fasciculata]EGG17738.1 hypothetical protein DFA_08737 [Cavenderia fasciculata]|eukprot:XP_004356222.1 hypothetical protein DFA_08737 [Cavenderia fasciculata]